MAMQRIGSNRNSPPVIAGRVNRAVDYLANGALMYVLFAGAAWFLSNKGLLLTDSIPGSDSWPVAIAHGVLPFLASALAAFGALAGLRLFLRHGRLRLSTSEHSATAVFISVVFLFAVVEAAVDWHRGMEPWWLPHLSAVLGALCGVAVRRRFAI